MNTQYTMQQLKTNAAFLGAQLVIAQESSCINAIMPLTRHQEKSGQTIGDFVATPNYNTQQENINLVMKFMNEWAERCQLKNDVKKKEVEEYVRNKLGTDDVWAKKALLLIFSKQTVSEQNVGHTVINNSVGFTGHDSEYLTSLAKQLTIRLESVKNEYPNLTEIEQIKKAWMSHRQMASLKKTIKKYWRQVIDASDEMKLLRAVKAARNVQQMTLNLA